MAFYEATANELVNRILALIPDHPEILGMEEPWGLHKIKGFQCDDLQPTLYQASWALVRAKHEYVNKEKTDA